MLDECDMQSNRRCRTRCRTFESTIQKKRTSTNDVSFAQSRKIIVLLLLSFMQSLIYCSNHNPIVDDDNYDPMEMSRTTLASSLFVQSERNTAAIALSTDRNIQLEDDALLEKLYSNSSSSIDQQQRERKLVSISQTITFYAIGDVPYNKKQANRLKGQMSNIPKDAEFVIHVGDIRENNKTNEECFRSEYTSVSDLLRLSHAPVFIVPGDNEWNDCSNRNQGRNWWTDIFLNFNSRYWSSKKFNVNRKIGRPENFHFTYKNILFIGLNIVGGPIPRPKKDWDNKLAEEFNWVKSLILSYIANLKKSSGRQDIVGRIVLFGHANPKPIHTAFFRPFANFVKNDLKNQIPILYLHGDLHNWVYNPQFMNQRSILRISLVGLGRNPPLKVTVHATGQSVSKLSEAFSYDRR